MKKILLAVTGMSPQIVTELIYALAMDSKRTFIPDEVHIITTSEGAERVQLMLLSKEPGWFHQLCNDYDLPDIHFTEENIHILEDAYGHPMNDIVTPEDNEAAADFIVSLVQEFTKSPDNILHASIAGGRKTMGYYLGYALSLYGRKSDQLSHVLVSEGYESLPDFFYPTPYEKIILNRAGKPLDSRKAKVWLANIGFVPMRHGVPKALLEGKTTYSGAVHAVMESFSEPSIVVDSANKRLICRDKEVYLSPKHMAFYMMFAERQKNGLPPLTCPVEGDLGDLELAELFFPIYKDILGEIGGRDDTFKLFTENGSGRIEKITHGMKKAYFEECKSRCNKKIREALSIDGSPYEIVGIGKRPKGYCLDGLKADQIKFRSS